MAGEYISLRELARRLGLSTSAAYRVLESTPIRRRELPGLPPKYAAADVAELVERSVVNSTRTVASGHCLGQEVPARDRMVRDAPGQAPARATVASPSWRCEDRP